MENLVLLEHTPLAFASAKHPPWKPRGPTALEPKTMKHNPYLLAKTWNLHAKAKGFTGAPASPQDANSTTNKPVNGKSQRRRDSGEDNDDKIPDVVLERMIARILFYVGVPLITGVALLQVFDAVKQQHLWDVPVWLPFLTTFITFGASALGIAYGTLSASWDPEKKGSLLGLEEAQENWAEMWREEEESKRFMKVRLTREGSSPLV